MELKSRVLMFCERKNISLSAFEKKAKLSNGYFNQVKKRPSKDKLDSISIAFPDLNIEWLLTEDGEMLNKSINDSVTQGNNSGNHNIILSHVNAEKIIRDTPQGTDIIIDGASTSSPEGVASEILRLQKENADLKSQLDKQKAVVEQLRSLIIDSIKKS